MKFSLRTNSQAVSDFLESEVEEGRANFDVWLRVVGQGSVCYTSSLNPSWRRLSIHYVNNNIFAIHRENDTVSGVDLAIWREIVKSLGLEASYERAKNFPELAGKVGLTNNDF